MVSVLVGIPRSVVDRYAADMQAQRAFEARRRRGDMH